MKLVYIASPYTYKSRFKLLRKFIEWLRYYQVTKVIGYLQDKHPNIAFIAPITQSHQTAKFMKNKNGEFSYWKNIDFKYIRQCNELWVIALNGWTESLGVKEEINYAAKQRLKIKYFDLNDIYEV